MKYADTIPYKYGLNGNHRVGYLDTRGVRAQKAHKLPVKFPEQNVPASALPDVARPIFVYIEACPGASVLLFGWKLQGRRVSCQ